MPSSLNRAKRTVLSRLISCLVNERLVTCRIIPNHLVPDRILVHQSINGRNWALVSKDSTIEDAKGIWIQLTGIIPTALAPIKNKRQNGIELLAIRLLDSTDMTFPIVASDGKIVIQISTLLEQIEEWRPDVPRFIFKKLSMELESCIHHQAEAYTFDENQKHLTLVDATAIDWEQSLVEGNPTHPMHKTRLGAPPVVTTPSLATILNPTIHFFALSKTEVKISGDYENLIRPLLEKVGIDTNLETIVPVHELQVPVILKHYPNARRVEYTEKGKGQASVRTVVLESLSGINLKLSLNMIMSSILRTLRIGETSYGQTLKRAIDEIVKDCADNLIVAHELGGVSVNHEDPVVAEYFGCVIRQDPEILLNSIGEKVIICAALVERRSNGAYVVNEIFDLQTKQDKIQFFTNYAQLLLRSFVPAIVKYGFAFEAHGQNTLGRFKFNPETGKWELVGFIIRDYAGIDANQEAMERALGFKIDTGENGTPTVIQRTMETVYSFGYSGIIHLHLHRLVRALSLHYSGEGWSIIRNMLENLLPKESEIRRIWLGSTTVHKCQLTMKLEQKSVVLQWDVPNLVLNTPNHSDS